MKLVFLTHRVPYAPNRGDRIRSRYLLDEMSRWADVHVVSLAHDSEEAAAARTLAGAASVTVVRTVSRARAAARALAALPTARPLTHVLLQAPELAHRVDELARRIRPDLVLAYCSGMAPTAMRLARTGLPFALDMVDVDSEKWQELAVSAAAVRRLVYAREARVLGRFEAEACRAARVTLVVNARERRLLEARVPGADVRVVPIGTDQDYFRPPADTLRRDEVVFCGVFDYPPNVDGAIWLARQVWPLVRRQRPSARLVIVGANPTRAVRALARADSTIEVAGTVPDVRPFLWRAEVAAAPLLVARGVQTKVFEAVAAGLPAVITPAVAEGLPAALLPACVVAGSAVEYAGRLADLLGAPAARSAMVRQVDVGRLSWSRQLQPLRSILEEAAFGSRWRGLRCAPM